MLPESKNIQTIADNIRSLENQINALDVEIPSHAAADAGKILAVDSDGDLEWREETQYIPPAYSTEEVNTGQKWIDGKDIYCIVITGQLPVIESNYTLTINDLIFDSVVRIDELLYDGSVYTVNRNVRNYTKTNSRFGVYSINAIFSEYYYAYSLYYTKSDPEPSTETKSKKGGNKK